MEMAGKKVIRKITIISTKRKGNIARVISSTRSPELPQAAQLRAGPRSGSARQKAARCDRHAYECHWQDSRNSLRAPHHVRCFDSAQV